MEEPNTSNGWLSKAKGWADSPIIKIASAIRTVFWVITGTFFGIVVVLGLLSYFLGSFVLVLVALCVAISLLVALIFYVWHLRRMRRQVLAGHETELGRWAERNDELAEALAEATFRNRSWEGLVAACRTVDQQMVKLRRRTNGDLEIERRVAINITLGGCRENILSQIKLSDRRVAFLEYCPQTHRFTAIGDAYLSDESINHVHERLSGDRGWAAVAMHDPDRSLVYEPRVGSEEARKRGFVQTTDTPSKGSICCGGIWVNGEVMGVVCADCSTDDALNQDDFDVMDVFRGKLELIYGVFPRSNEISSAG